MYIHENFYSCTSLAQKLPLIYIISGWNVREMETKETFVLTLCIFLLLKNRKEKTIHQGEGGMPQNGRTQHKTLHWFNISFVSMIRP